MTEQVTRHRGGGRDENGQLVTASTAALTAIGVAPGGGSHRLDRGRDGEDIAYTVYLPTGTDLVNGDSYTVSSSSPAAVSGYPNITVPMGYVDGLPVGISFFGRAWSEPLLIEIAYSYEQGTKYRKAPEFLPSLPFEVVN